MRETIRAARASRFRSRPALEKWQEQLARRHLARVVRSSSFYACRLNRHNLSTWRALPITTKQIRDRHFGTINTLGLSESSARALQIVQSQDGSDTTSGLSIGFSTGTTGNRSLFILSPEEQARWAANILYKFSPTWWMRPHRATLIYWGTGRPFFASNRGLFSFSFIDVTLPSDAIIEQLNAHHPTILVAPPSILRSLAQAKHRGNCHICPAHVFITGEIADKLDLSLIASSFGPPRLIYQAVEGFLGISCRYGRLHLNEDALVVEADYLDGTRTRFCPIVTDFVRITQPVIRHRLDDVLLEISEPCACGSVFRSVEILGRLQDTMMINSKSDSSSYIPVFPDQVRQTMCNIEGVADYRVTQTGPRTIELALLSNSNGDLYQSASVALASLFDRCGADKVDIQFRSLDPEPRDRKLRKIRRSWATPYVSKFGGCDARP